jgi:hypothetical protein
VDSNGFCAVLLIIEMNIFFQMLRLSTNPSSLRKRRQRIIPRYTGGTGRVDEGGGIVLTVVLADEGGDKALGVED